MARVLGPDFLALQVRDLTASAQFYTERLGLERAAHSPPNAVVFRTEPVPFALREPVVDLAASPRLGWGVALWFLTDDADQLHTALEAAGVPITQPLQDGPFGRQFAFADPDGYQITVHGRP
jgi:catechol 2,3-dioxygenase-like lactoylglutathione lyase family enzyme